MNEGLKVFVNKSCASSVLKTDNALETASISSWRVFLSLFPFLICHGALF